MSRAKPSHIPLFVDSYIADTRHLTPEQDGANLRLLMAAWLSSDCSLPDDDRRLSSIIGMPETRWRKIGGAVLELWTRENGRIIQKRLLKEWNYVHEKRRKAREAVAIREQRKDSARTSFDDRTMHRTMNTYGEGGGVGDCNHPIQEEGFGGSSRVHAREAGPFSVIRGGGK